MMTGLDFLVQRDSYQEYLRRLDVRAVLDHYGAQNISEIVNHDGTTELLHSCLLDRVHPHHKDADRNPSACANVEKKLYVCYGFGGMNFFQFIAAMEGKESLADIVPVVGRFLSGAVQEASSFLAELDKLFASSHVHSVDPPIYSDRILDSWEKPHPYWNHRGITEEAQKLLRLGYDDRERRIVFPVFMALSGETKLVGWQKRVVPGETVPEHPKYRNSSGFPKSETLYGLDLARNSPLVVVVESPMSVARAYSVGLSVPVVGTFGSKVSVAQIERLRRFDAVLVWFDRDAAGAAGEHKLIEGLHEHTTTLVVTPDGGIDMADCTRAEMEHKLGEAEPAVLRLARYDREDRKHGRQAGVR